MSRRNIFDQVRSLLFPAVSGLEAKTGKEVEGFDWDPSFSRLSLRLKDDPHGARLILTREEVEDNLTKQLSGQRLAEAFA